MHIAVVKRAYKDKVYESVLLRHSYREDGKVKNETIANLTELPPDVIAILRSALKGEKLVSLAQSFEIQVSRPHGHVKAVLAAMEQLGLPQLISSTPSRERNIILGVIAARILAPHTKLATTRWWKTCTLAQELDLLDVTETEIYAAMDWLHERQEGIEKRLAKRHLHEGATALYDLSSSYVTGTKCPFAMRGYNRDRKKGTLQVNYGLLTDNLGRPVAVTLYPGNTSDSLTVGDQVDVLRKQFKLSSVVLVGDRGMITQTHIENFQTEDNKGIEWVTALRSGAIRKLSESGKLQLGLFDERNLASITHPDFPGEQLIACRNPSLAELRKHTRDDLLQATCEVLDGIKVRVDAGRLEGEDAIGVAVGRVVNRYKVAKHFLLTITDHTFDYEVDEVKVREEAALDGLYVIRTSMSAEKLSPEHAVRTYKLLGQVERAFRCIKTVDLMVRPIHHRLTNRVSSHIFMCVLAYYVEWHLREAWKGLTYADEDMPLAMDRDPVLPTQRSAQAKLKISTRKTTGGLPIHSYRTLIEALGALTRNTCRRPSTDTTFTLDSMPDDTQAAAQRMAEGIQGAA